MSRKNKIIIFFITIISALPLLIFASDTAPPRKKILKKVPHPSTSPSYAPTPKKEIAPALVPTVEVREVPVEKIVEKEVIREVTVTPPITHAPTPHPTYYPKIVAREDLPVAGTQEIYQAAIINAVFWATYLFKKSRQKLNFALKETEN